MSARDKSLTERTMALWELLLIGFCIVGFVFTWMFHALKKIGVPVQRNEALEVTLELL